MQVAQKMVEIQMQKDLGVKRFGGETVRAGNILIRQRGMKFKPGIKCRMWKRFYFICINRWNC